MNIKNHIVRLNVPVVLAATLLAATPSQAAYTLFGDAGLVSPGNASAYAARITSASASAPGYGGLSFTVPAGTDVNALNALATDYLKFAGDCGGGSPRYSIAVDKDGNNIDDDGPNNHIFVYIGPPPNFTGCSAGWQSTGNLLSGTVDTAQLGYVGSGPYDTWANAQANVGTKKVFSISLVVDSYWAGVGFDPQTFYVDNVNINNVDLYTFEPPVPANKDACKKDGWKVLTRADYTPFKNQGDCIQYVNTGK